MNERLRDTFRRLSETGRTGLIPYITAGDPDLGATGHILDALVDAGCDVIELGVPFSDPMADGPVIEAAMVRSLAAGTTFPKVLELVRRFRDRHPDTPLVLFGYINPLFRYGLERAARDAAEAGADAFLVVDMPPEEAQALAAHLPPHGLDLVTLYTPTTGPDRIAQIARYAGGFAYCVSMTGVTGGEVAGLDQVADRVAQIREGTGLPVAVGFGIRTPADALRVAAFADAVVVGSALVGAMAAVAPVEAPLVAGKLMGEMRRQLDG